jgi:hypothetical protein
VLAYRVPTEGPAVWACVSRDEILQRWTPPNASAYVSTAPATSGSAACSTNTSPNSPRWCARRCGCCTPPPDKTTPTAAWPAKPNTRPCSPPLPGSSNGTQGTNADAGQQDGALDPVLADLAGRVETWVLYGADESDPAEDSAAVAALHACHQAGAYARTVADLLLQWAVFDRRAALVTLATPGPAGGAAPTVASH